MRKHIFILSLVTCLLLLVSCSEDLNNPTLPAVESDVIAQGKPLSADVLFGVWEGGNYRVEFQSIDDGDAVFSHWFLNGMTNVSDSICDIEYNYTLDGSTIEMTPKRGVAPNNASTIKAVYTGDNTMVLYTVKEQITKVICTLTRTGDPEPSITSVDRTMPQVGEVVTMTGRNLQFVDHLYLPTYDGEIEVTNFDATTKQIRFTVPDADFAPGYARCLSTSAHVSAYSPAMFCTNCVFFHNFSTQGAEKPYIGTEFENTINITQSLMDDKISVVSSDNLPAGHALTLTDNIISPKYMLCFFGDTPKQWFVDDGLDPDTGMLRFSFGDRIQYVIDSSNGMITPQSKCKDVAIEMDIYVYSNGEPVWNTGFISFRLDKDQGKSLTQSWFAQTTMWDADNTVSFADGWKTFTIPLNTFAVTKDDAYSTVGNLMNYLKNGGKQSVIKFINTKLDDKHPAKALESFQICIANMRLVPYGKRNNTKEQHV